MSDKSLENLSKMEVFNNFHVLSKVVRSIVKSDSKTDHEFSIKYDVKEKIERKFHQWGRGGQLTVFGGMCYYFLKGYSPKLKVFIGFLYMYWNQHFYTLSSYIGISLHLKWGVDKLNMGDQYETGQRMQKIIKLLKQRQKDQEQGVQTVSDSKLLENFYKEQAGNTDAFSKSFLKNDYFVKNYDKYVKDSSQNDYKVFDPISNDYFEDKMKLKYCDSFLSRYIYYSFTRWANRLGKSIGLVKDI